MESNEKITLNCTQCNKDYKVDASTLKPSALLKRICPACLNLQNKSGATKPTIIGGS